MLASLIENEIEAMIAQMMPSRVCEEAATCQSLELSKKYRQKMRPSDAGDKLNDETANAFLAVVAAEGCGYRQTAFAAHERT